MSPLYLCISSEMDELKDILEKEGFYRVATEEHKAELVELIHRNRAK